MARNIDSPVWPDAKMDVVVARMRRGEGGLLMVALVGEAECGLLPSAEEGRVGEQTEEAANYAGGGGVPVCSCTRTAGRALASNMYVSLSYSVGTK